MDIVTVEFAAQGIITRFCERHLVYRLLKRKQGILWRILINPNHLPDAVLAFLPDLVAVCRALEISVSSSVSKFTIWLAAAWAIRGRFFAREAPAVTASRL
jgi:hypothetical protein